MTNQYKVRRSYTALYVCQHCGKKLFAHHVRPGGKFESLAAGAAGECCPKCGCVGTIKPCAPPPPAPSAPPPPPLKKPHLRGISRRNLPKQFVAFLEGRCKDLKLAAKILGVTPRPPLLKQTIRAAWISLISKHHPDKGGDLQAAQAVNGAYQLLAKFSR